MLFLSLVSVFHLFNVFAARSMGLPLLFCPEILAFSCFVSMFCGFDVFVPCVIVVFR